jgi:hypothetical protein
LDRCAFQDAGSERCICGWKRAREDRAMDRNVSSWTVKAMGKAGQGQDWLNVFLEPLKWTGCLWNSGIMVVCSLVVHELMRR